jgi:ketosteroid isomerase-like protein
MAVDQPKKPISTTPGVDPETELKPNPAVDEFLTRLTKDMRHAKPGKEAISAAFEAIQRLTVEADAEAADIEQTDSSMCNSCGASNRAGNRFCSTCGVPLHVAAVDAIEVSSSSAPRVELPKGDHHYHHHYHHHYFSSSEGLPAAPAGEPRPAAVGGRIRASVPGAGLSRAEAAVRKLTQDWALACNGKHIDDLIDLYTADATVMRPNYPAVRGSSALREFFCGLLDAGLGDVELDPVRTEVLGEVAYEAGRCKSLVPAVGKRREDRGKYLLVCLKQNAEWRIVADSWSSDLGVATEIAPPGSASPAKPPRK